MGSLGSPVLLLLFLASAAVIWYAGIKLSGTTDVLSERLHLGSALGGLILLAIATNLPEIAITATAAVGGQLEVAVGNILGGIAVQTVVLAVLDAVGAGPRAPLTRMAASLVLVLEGVLVIVVLAVVVMGTQLSGDLSFARVTPAPLAVAALWVIGLVLLDRAGKGLPWREGGDAPGAQPEPRGHSKGKKEKAATDQGVSTLRAVLVFTAAAAATLAAGVVIERSGETFFARQGLSGILFGATVLAVATSLPEISTGLTSTKLGDHQLAVSDIFGGNAFLPVLFLLAAVLSGKPVLPAAHDTDVYLTALGIVLTGVYVAGLVFRPHRQYLRMGVDSVAVVVLYGVGVAGLATIGS
ncbi:sodium:calcium antiporter [Streptomyces sp. NPDC020490]|uniref:sodium:calcium antiporter n=1 Tax=Streptomyces sp. NPDC020490 TaxID=3365078 RepID=UPI003788C3C4